MKDKNASIRESSNQNSNYTEITLTGIDVVEEYLKNSNYETRFNEVTGKVEIRKGGKSFIPMTDRTINSLHREILKQDIDCTATLLKLVLYSDFSANYNPFKEYFLSLPEWDQKTDHILSLAQTVNTNNQDFWYNCFKKWIVGMTASLLADDIVNHIALIFSGKQGIGKTTWITRLVPIQLKEYYFSGTINPNNKDTLIHLSECCLINMDELESMNRSEIESLKELITKPGIKIRRPYAVTPEYLPHRASFAGSVNASQFLTDTENRRFACFEVLNIDYNHQISIDNVLSQALYLFKNSFSYWFSNNEIEALSSSNEQFRLMTTEEETLLIWFQPCLQSDATHFLTTTELEAHLIGNSKLTSSEATRNRLGKALRKHRFERLKKEGRYVYVLKKRR